MYRDFPDSLRPTDAAGLTETDAGLTARGSCRLRGVRRFDLVMSADELMTELVDSDPTADQIAQLLGVSHRVLNYAFQDAFGVGPYRYFLAKRLHGARRQPHGGLRGVDDSRLDLGLLLTHHQREPHMAP